MPISSEIEGTWLTCRYSICQVLYFDFITAKRVWSAGWCRAVQLGRKNTSLRFCTPRAARSILFPEKLSRRRQYFRPGLFFFKNFENLCKVCKSCSGLLDIPLSISIRGEYKRTTELRFSRCIYKTTDVQRAERGLYGCML
jgi:hypothetical protein